MLAWIRKLPILLPGSLVAASVALIGFALSVHPATPQETYFAAEGTAAAYNTDFLQCRSIVAYWTNASVNLDAKGSPPGQPEGAEELIISQALAIASPLVAQGSYMSPTYVSDVGEVIDTGCESSYGGLYDQPQTPPAPSTDSPSATYASPLEVAKAFFLAWQNGDRLAALGWAKPRWGDALFSHPPTGYVFDDCSEGMTGSGESFLSCLIQPGAASDQPVPIQFNVFTDAHGAGYYVADIYAAAGD